MQATIVFQKIWDALQARNDDGTRKYRYIILEGSSRSSKTRSLLQIYYLYCKAERHKRCSVWRDTAKDCRDTVGNDMEKVYPNMVDYNFVSYHSTKSIYRFLDTKSNIEICGTDDVDKVHGYQGNIIWLNEPYKISRDTFDQLDMRTEDVVFFDWNPKKAHFIDDIKKDPRAITIHSTFKDNPFCPPEQRIKILGYQPIKNCEVVELKLVTENEAREYDISKNELKFTDKQIKELIRCKFNEDKNSADSFKWQVYGLGTKAEKPNRIFKWTEIPLSDYLNIVTNEIRYGVDWGTVHSWGIVELKLYDGALYVRQLNYLSENQWREKMDSTDRLQIEAEDAGKTNDQKTGIVQWLFSKLSIPFSSSIECDNNRPTKILKLRDMGWEYAIAAIKVQGSIIDGIDILSDIPVYFSSDSEDLKHEQETYSRKIDRYGVVQEEPEDDNNHLIDPIRYIALRMRQEGLI